MTQYTYAKTFLLVFESDKIYIKVEFGNYIIWPLKLQLDKQIILYQARNLLLLEVRLKCQVGGNIVLK